MVRMSMTLTLPTLLLKIQSHMVSHRFLTAHKTVMEVTAIDSTSLVSCNAQEQREAKTTILEQSLHCHQIRSNLLHRWQLVLKCIILHSKISNKQLKWVRDRGYLNGSLLDLI